MPALHPCAASAPTAFAPDNAGKRLAAPTPMMRAGFPHPGSRAAWLAAMLLVVAAITVAADCSATTKATCRPPCTWSSGLCIGPPVSTPAPSDVCEVSVDRVTASRRCMPPGTGAGAMRACRVGSQRARRRTRSLHAPSPPPILHLSAVCAALDGVWQRRSLLRWAAGVQAAAPQAVTALVGSQPAASRGCGAAGWPTLV